MATFVCFVLIASCGGRTQVRVVAPAGPKPEPPPDWVKGVKVTSERICGVGVAGRTYRPKSKKAEELSAERAARNLAGVFETAVIEAQIITQTGSGRTEMEFARGVEVDDALIETIAAAAENDFWYDVEGQGPYAKKGYTYARACVSASVAMDKLKVDKSKLRALEGEDLVHPERPPKWLSWVGSQHGARLCTIGYSLPAFHPEEEYQNVVDDARGQLVTAARSVVMNAFEEIVDCSTLQAGRCTQLVEDLTAATTEAVSRGVVVTHYWYDRDGKGPNAQRRTTYGWACTYPVNALNVSVTAKVPPPEKPTIDKVKERAEEMFGELEEEEFKRAAKGQPINPPPGG